MGSERTNLTNEARRQRKSKNFTWVLLTQHRETVQQQQQIDSMLQSFCFILINVSVLRCRSDGCQSWVFIFFPILAYLECIFERLLRSVRNDYCLALFVCKQFLQRRWWWCWWVSSCITSNSPLFSARIAIISLAVVHWPMHFQFQQYFTGAVQAKLNMKLLCGMILVVCLASDIYTTENGKSQMTAVGIITSGNINFLTNEWKTDSIETNMKHFPMW